MKYDDENKSDEIIAYNDIIQFVTQEADHNMSDQFWKFKCISGHQGPLHARQEGYNGSMWNVQVKWEDGSCTYEPLSVIATDDPVSCAVYARDNGLLDEPGWKHFKKIANQQKKLVHLLHQN